VVPKHDRSNYWYSVVLIALHDWRVRQPLWIELTHSLTLPDRQLTLTDLHCAPPPLDITLSEIVTSLPAMESIGIPHA